MSESLEVADGQTSLRLVRHLPHPPEKVWRAVTEPSQLAAWFPYQVEIDELAVRQPIRFIDPHNEHAEPDSGVILEVDPPRVFAFTWGKDDGIRIELEAERSGCRLIFVHSFIDRYGAASFTIGWQTCIDALDAALDGREFTPQRDMDEGHDEYVIAFGLDEGVIEPTVSNATDAWQVRFERQLTRPAETVWHVLTVDGTPTTGSAVPPTFTVVGTSGGTVQRADEAKVVEYIYEAGRVRWELGPGTGQGARLVVTQTGPEATVRTAAPAWKTRLQGLADELRTTPRPSRPGA